MATSIEPFNRLVKLAARAFYDDITMKGDNQPKNGRGDNRGMAVVVLDALTRRQWVREEDLAKALKLHSKQLRRTLRFFEEEKLVTRDHRKESAKGSKVFSAAVAATVDSQQFTRDGEEKMKMHTHSYCCLDYAQIYDIVRYRIHKMRLKLKSELEDRNTIQEYICPNCGKRYNAFDALRLMSPHDDSFHCESCNGELVAESDKIAAEEMGDGDDNAKRRRQEKLKDMLQKMEEQLKPLTNQINVLKGLPIPEFGSLQAWESRVHAVTRGDPESNLNDPLKSSQGHGGTPMPFLGETKVEVALPGLVAKEESIGTDDKPTDMKVLPPWMIREGMTLTKQQRGEFDREPAADQKSNIIDEKKPKAESQDEKTIQDEYAKAYYAALLKRQQEQEEANRLLELERENAASTSYSETLRQVGDKAKRESDEEIPPAAKTFKVDLNLEADQSPEEDEDDDDDDIEWEEG